MKKYEAMVIIQNDRKSAEALAFSKEQIVKRIQAAGGTITFEDFWGERGFAYKIKGMKWGYYFVCQFEAEPTAIAELTKEWNLTKGLVRFLISLVDKKAPAPVSHADMRKGWAAKAQEADIAEIDESAKATTAPKKKDAVDATLDKLVDDATASL